MASDSTLWEREPHTEGKHLVLSAYLDAWYPILGSWNGRILFIDGFAGPGRYADGEDGSPVIALRSLIEHNARKTITAEVVFVFIEKDEDRAAHLDSVVDELRPELPPNSHVSITTGAFDRSMSQVLKTLDDQKTHLAPAFVMIDPFGVSGTPMSVISRIMENPQCEVYITFMFESMNRFIGTPEFESNLDELFGNDMWRDAIPLTGEERRDFLYDLYERQLRNAGAAHVIHFDLYEGNRLVYAIFFGTQHIRGCDEMKKAIWKVAPGPNFAFRGSKTEQLELNVEEPNFKPLRRQLLGRFRGRGWVTVEDVLDFVGSDATEYHSSQVKTPVLKPLEREGFLKVDEATRKRRGTYPDGCRLKLASPD